MSVLFYVIIVIFIYMTIKNIIIMKRKRTFKKKPTISNNPEHNVQKERTRGKKRPTKV
jgi:hypothetical protein